MRLFSIPLAYGFDCESHQRFCKMQLKPYLQLTGSMQRMARSKCHAQQRASFFPMRRKFHSFRTQGYMILDSTYLCVHIYMSPITFLDLSQIPSSIFSDYFIYTTTATSFRTGNHPATILHPYLSFSRQLKEHHHEAFLVSHRRIARHWLPRSPLNESSWYRSDAFRI